MSAKTKEPENVLLTYRVRKKIPAEDEMIIANIPGLAEKKRDLK